MNSNIQQDTVTYITFENDPEYPSSYNNFTDTLGEVLYVPQLANGNFLLNRKITGDSVGIGDSPPIFGYLKSQFEINAGHDLIFNVTAHDPDGDSIILLCKTILPTYGHFEPRCGDSSITQTFFLRPDSSIKADTTLHLTFSAQDQRGYNTLKQVEIEIKAEEMTAVDDGADPSISQSFSLLQNYPNPFNSNTEIWFSLPRNCDVSLEIYNIKGELVKRLVQGGMDPGVHRFSWDGTNRVGSKVTSGVYFCRLKTQAYEKVIKMAILK